MPQPQPFPLSQTGFCPSCAEPIALAELIHVNISALNPHPGPQTTPIYQPGLRVPTQPHSSSGTDGVPW